MHRNVRLLKDEAQITLFKHLESRFRINAPRDWYKIKTSDVQTSEGADLLKRYNNSMKSMLEAFYPDLEWQYKKSVALYTYLSNSLKRFAHVPLHYWKDKRNHKEQLTIIEKHLGITSMEDWYSITKTKLELSGGRGLLRNYKSSISTMLKSLYPIYNWDITKYATFIIALK